MAGRADYLRARLNGFGIAFIALAVTLLAYQIPLLQRASLAVQDIQVSLTAPPLTYDDVLVVDIDEASIRALASQLGPWPYNRDVYALVNDYLRESGAKVVVYDILFAEPRAGDEPFAASLDATGNAVLIASALPAVERGAPYQAQLAKSALSGLDAVAAQSWPDLTIPVPQLGNARGVRLGINTVTTDAGGIVRRIPLIHEVYGKRHASLPLAALVAGNPDATLGGDRASVTLGKLRWPLTPAGEVELRYPPTLNGLVPVSFYKVVLAALGAEGAGDVARSIRGKTVFIGSSTAILGDYIETPGGKVAGLYVAAMIHQMLAQGSILHPAKPTWDVALFLIAVVIPLFAFLPRLKDRPYAENLAGMVMLLVVTSASTALIARSQQAALLFPLLAGMLTYLGLMLTRLVALSAEKYQLGLEKRAAQEAHRLKEQFMSHISHELRTPLTAIIGYNKLLADVDLATDRRTQYSDIVHKNSDHLLNLINNILDQSRIEGGQMKVVPSPTDFRRLVGDVLLTLGHAATNKGLALESSIAEPLPAGLDLDPLRVKQVLINLIGNAIKFTEAGRVVLACEWHDDRLTLAIRDTGPGMTTEQVQRIFTPFAQAHDGVAQKFGGSGLGLSISRMLCTLMGGEISVESSPGVGTTFTATIAAAACPLQVVEAPAMPAVAAKLAGRVLVADDNDDNRDLVELYLIGMGITVLTAENGRQAVDFALAEQPDVVLMDVEMPELTGIEATAQLRKNGFMRPVVLLTGYDEVAIAAEARDAGINAVLTKPIDRQQLHTMLTSLLAAPAAKP